MFVILSPSSAVPFAEADSSLNPLIDSIRDIPNLSACLVRNSNDLAPLSAPPTEAFREACNASKLAPTFTISTATSFNFNSPYAIPRAPTTFTRLETVILFAFSALVSLSVSPFNFLVFFVDSVSSLFSLLLCSVFSLIDKLLDLISFVNACCLAL